MHAEKSLEACINANIIAQFPIHVDLVIEDKELFYKKKVFLAVHNGYRSYNSYSYTNLKTSYNRRLI
jgi:hypothetical protein